MQVWLIAYLWRPTLAAAVATQQRVQDVVVGPTACRSHVRQQCLACLQVPRSHRPVHQRRPDDLSERYNMVFHLRHQALVNTQ